MSPTCRCATTNGAGMISNPNTRSVAAFFTRDPTSAPSPLSLEVLRNAAQHLADVRAGAAAWIEHVHVLSRQPVRDAEVVPERHVHARHHVPHNLRRRVPDSEPLSQRGVECLQERLVEVLHRLSLVEPLEERLPVNAVERVGSPVQHLDEVQRPQPPGGGQLLEQRLQHGNAQLPRRLVPVERSRRSRRPARPQHPRGEHAIEERLHQRRPEERRAAFSLELHSQRVLQRRPDRDERRRVSGGLDPRQPVPRVRR